MPAFTNRRSILNRALGCAALTRIPSATFAKQKNAPNRATDRVPVSGESVPALAPFDRLMTSFVKNHQVPGAALAVSRHGKIVYARGFGYADVDRHRPVEPDSLFRIASVSKPLTATAVMQLAAEKRIALNDSVFDRLPAREWLSPKADDRLKRVTIRQLLHHTGGWDRSVSFDPIGRPLEIAKTLRKALPVGPNEVVRYTLTLPLDFAPGTRYAYSNVGYLLLGRLIEEVSGLNYQAFVKEKVLAPIGVTRTKLGRAWVDDLDRDEVRYFDSKRREWPAVNGPRLGAKVPLVYGGENFEAFEAHGGWIASTIDLVRFASAFDDPANSKLLDANGIAEMFARPEGAPGFADDGKPRPAFYACGWNVRPVGQEGRANTWHSGLIAGTSSILVRRYDGLNWAVLFNIDSAPTGETLSGLIDPLVHQAANAVKTWPQGEEPVGR
jgi:N-acyl-D-amino-acid deacylase